MGSPRQEVTLSETKTNGDRKCGMLTGITFQVRPHPTTTHHHHAMTGYNGGGGGEQSINNDEQNSTNSNYDKRNRHHNASGNVGGRPRDRKGDDDLHLADHDIAKPKTVHVMARDNHTVDRNLVTKVVKLITTGFTKTDTIMTHTRAENIFQIDLLVYADRSNIKTSIQILLAKSDVDRKHMLEVLGGDNLRTIPEFWERVKGMRFPNLKDLVTDQLCIF